jgi:hypothetical protein
MADDIIVNALQPDEAGVELVAALAAARIIRMSDTMISGRRNLMEFLGVERTATRTVRAHSKPEKTFDRSFSTTTMYGDRNVNWAQVRTKSTQAR